uniref:Uncharacterized protein n=1 Tax=Arundo donax TaxID=35708 RepID=A0A0A9FKU0_ARUDO
MISEAWKLLLLAFSYHSSHKNSVVHTLARYLRASAFLSSLAAFSSSRFFAASALCCRIKVRRSKSFLACSVFPCS